MILSERAWISYSYINEIAETEEDRCNLIQACSKMLLDAIDSNPSNVTARMRLGTLIHIYGPTYLKDIDIPQKQEQTKWLQALKLDPSNPELFYCIGLYNYLHKGDLKKGQSCIEKAITLNPNLIEAQYLLCVILMSNE